MLPLLLSVAHDVYLFVTEVVTIAGFRDTADDDVAVTVLD